MVCYHCCTSSCCANYQSPVQHFSLGALESILNLDTDSDSDIIPLKGLPTTQPYPNCCRWHLTEARCRYKWQEPSICAPFAIRVASTNLYSSSEGTMTDCVGTVTRLHGPITPRSPTLHPELPTTSRTSSPPLSPASSQPPSGASAPSRSISRVSSQSASPTSSPVGASSRSGVSSQPPPLSTQPQRWYAITKGRSICVVEGW